MDYSALQTDLLRCLRQNRTQSQVSQKLGFKFNQIYRWESGRTRIDWKDFVQFCRLCEVDLAAALQTCFSYFKNPSDGAALSKHFIGSRTQAGMAKELGISRYSLSRWMRGQTVPQMTQMLKLMHLGSVDFFRFVEALAGPSALPSIHEELQSELAHLALYDRFPWLSILLSALDLAEYQQQPTIDFLSKKSKLPPESVEQALQALQQQNLAHWNGVFWEARLKRIAIRGSLEMRKKMARYTFHRVLDGIEPGLGTSAMRFSWKHFSLNQNQLEVLLQKFTEFFNELGGLIDQSQEGADKVYLFSAAFVDFDALPVSTKKPPPADRI